MKTLFTLVTILAFLAAGDLFAQTGVSINDDGTGPDAQSLLDLNVNSPSGANRLKGVLLPRMSTADRDHATYGVNPGAGDVGLMIYNTTTSTYQYWDGSMWVDVGTGTGNASTLDEAYDGDGSGLGRTIAADAGNVEIQGAGHLTVAANIGVGTTTPASKLEVQFSGAGGILLDGDDSGDARIQFENGGGIHTIFDDQSDNNNLKLESPSGRSIAFNTDGSNERMVVQSDGRLRVNNLADPSGAVITSNPSGVLGKTPLTAGINDILVGTGIFTDANNLNITTAGGWTDDGAVVRLTTISDNVGIGTVSPNNRLSVDGSSTDTNPILGLRSGNDNNGFNNGAQIAFGYNGSNTYQHFIQTRHNTSNSQNAIDFYVSDGTQNNTVTSGSIQTLSMVSGNVGVGTTSPSQKLHVSDNSNGDGGWDDGGILVQNTGTAGEAALSFNNSETGSSYWITGVNQSAHLDIAYGGTFTNGNTHLRVQTDGNIGIGTVAPSTQLHTTGGVRFQNLTGTGSRFVVADANGNLSAGSSTTAGIVTGSGTTNYLARWTPDGSTLGIGVVFDNGANVGVGTTSPSSLLDVQSSTQLPFSLQRTGNVGDVGIEFRDNNANAQTGYFTFNHRDADSQNNGASFHLTTTEPALGVIVDGPGGYYADSQLALRSNGNSYLTGGNLGIGTTSPSEDLHIWSNTDASIWLQADANNATESDNAYIKITQDGQLINSVIGLTGAAGVDPEGNAYTGALNNSLLVGTTTSGAPLQLGVDSEVEVTISTAGNVGVGTTAPNDKLDVVGNGQVSGYMKVGNPTTGSTTRYGSETFFMTSSMSLSSGYSNSPSLGTITVPTGAANFTVTKVIYSFTGYHDDGDEQHGAMVRIGSTDFGGVFEVGSDGYTDVTWNNTSNHSTSFSSTQNVYFRLYDENDNCLFCSNNTFYVLNANITVYYSYSVGAQTGDVLASGTVYSKNVHSTNTIGDVAEYFNVKTEAGQMPQVGQLVSFAAASETEFKLSNSPYDNLIAGVISENPSVVLNKPNDGAPIALTGRVKVQLVDSDKLITSGDFITSSNQAGLGMRATTAGPVIGYAISNQKPGDNTVEVLLQPGRFYFPKKELEKSEPENVKRKPGMTSSPR